MNTAETVEDNVESNTMDVSVGDAATALPRITNHTEVAASPTHSPSPIEVSASPGPTADSQTDKSVTPSLAPVKTSAKKRSKSKADGQDAESPKKKTKGTPKERQRKVRGQSTLPR